VRGVWYRARYSCLGAGGDLQGAVAWAALATFVFEGVCTIDQQIARISLAESISVAIFRAAQPVPLRSGSV